MGKSTRTEQNAEFFGNPNSKSQRKERTPKEKARANDRFLIGFGIVVSIIGGLMVAGGINYDEYSGVILGGGLLTLLALLGAVFYWAAKREPGVGRAYTPTEPHKGFFEELMSYWHTRYLVAIVYGIVAWFSAVVYLSGNEPDFGPIYLISHPITGVLAALLTIYAARELAIVVLIIVIIIAIGLFIAVLPIPVAIVVGACIIAAAIILSRRWS